MQPILRYVREVDSNPRDVTPEEAERLLASKEGRGDWFAHMLSKTPPTDRPLTLRALLGSLPKGSYRSFAVADGIPIKYDHKNLDNPLNSVSRHLRFIIIALPDDQYDGSKAFNERTLCIVGSANPDGDSAFLQCLSWDPHALGKKKGLTRFFQRESKYGWLYFGDGFDAFIPASAPFGPFDGHIGGAMIMKELREPWTHWFATKNGDEFQASLGSTPKEGSSADRYNALYDELFTAPGQVPFSLVGSAEDLEPIVLNSIRKWYISRFAHDFHKPGTSEPLETISSGIKNWAQHILCNYSMNIATSATSTAKAQSEDTERINGIPVTFFLNFQALQTILKGIKTPGEMLFSTVAYRSNIQRLKLSLYYDDYSTDPPTRRIAVKGSEGPFTFPIIEPGFEDTHGVAVLVKCSYGTTPVLPAKAIAAMLMVDFWNPLYSARREKLMQYLPLNAHFNPDTSSYNLLDQFSANVRASPASRDETSSEYEVLQLLNTPDDEWNQKFTDRINGYLSQVTGRLNNPEDHGQAAIDEYMVLAEGQRRLFRGRENSKPDGAGLNEFMLTLPIAALPDPFPITKMKETGEVIVMPEAEVVFLEARAETQGRRSGGSCPAQLKGSRAGRC